MMYEGHEEKPGLHARIMYDSRQIDQYSGDPLKYILIDFCERLAKILKARDSGGKPSGHLIIDIDFALSESEDEE
jgi:hypothetical protein